MARVRALLHFRWVRPRVEAGSEAVVHDHPTVGRGQALLAVSVVRHGVLGLQMRATYNAMLMNNVEDKQG